MDISAEIVNIHRRTDAKHLVATARTIHLLGEKKTIHMFFLSVAKGNLCTFEPNSQGGQSDHNRKTA